MKQAVFCYRHKYVFCLIKYTADIRWQKSRPVLLCVRMKNRCFIPEYLQSYLCEVTELCEVILFWSEVKWSELRLSSWG